MEITQAEQPGSASVTLHPRQMGPLPLRYPILGDLGVRDTVTAVAPTEADINLGRVALWRALNRLLASQPLYRAHEWLAETVLPEVLGIAPAQAYDNRSGRALDRLYPHLGELWARIAARAIQVYAGVLRVLHGDITSLSVEGAYADSLLVAYGYRRDQRPDTKQVNREAGVSHDGAVPVLHQVLSGNTVDITRPPPHLRALLRFLARSELAERQPRPILARDCAMITAEAVVACHRHDLYYPGPWPNSTAAEAVVRSVTAEEPAAQPLACR